VFGLTTVALNILTMLAIRGCTDYAHLHPFGLYREAAALAKTGMTLLRTFQSVSPVIVGSGLTIAWATYCSAFRRLPYFITMGAPVWRRHGRVVAIAVTLRAGRAVPREPRWSLLIQKPAP